MVSASPVRTADFEDFFQEIGLDVEEPMVEVPPQPHKKKKSAKLAKRMGYKYLKARKFFCRFSGNSFHRGNAGSFNHRHGFS